MIETSSHVKMIYPLKILIFLLLFSAFLLDLDALALYTFVGRVAIFDLIVIIFIVFLLITQKITFVNNYKELNFFIITWYIFVFFILTTGYLLFLFYNVNFNEVISITSKYFLYSTLVFLLTNYLIVNDWSDNFLKIVLKLNFIVIIIGVTQILAVNQVPIFKEVFLWENIRGNGTRIAATFRWQGVFSLYLGIILPLVISQILKGKGNISNYILLIFMVIAGFYSGSRSFMIVLLPSFFIFLIKPFITNNFKFSIIKLIAIGISMLGFIYIFTSYLLDSRAVKRIFSLDGALGISGETSPRERIAQAGLTHWLDSPLIGIGSGNLKERVGEAAHNSYLEIIYENGLFGFVIYLSMILLLVFMVTKLFQQAFILKDIFPISLAVIIINVLLYQLTASAIQYRIIWITYPLIFSFYYEFKYNLLKKT